LEVLDLHGNQISNSGFQHQTNSTFGGLRGHPKLRVLNLASNRLTSIDGLTDLPHLVELNLRRNRIRAVADSSAALASMHRLQRVYLSHNSISR
jgi:Leucine-rich repeat (LRR) protein